MLYASDFRYKAREALSGNWALAIGTGLIAALLGANGYSSSSNNRVNIENFNDTFGTIISNTFLIGLITFLSLYVIFLIIVGGAIELGYCQFNLNLVNDTNPKFIDLFSKFNIFWKALGMRLLTGLYIFLWTLLLIIPGIIASFSYAMTPYILAENPSMGINEAISLSKQMMDGNKWRYFCLNLSFIGWAILCLFTLGIGYLWLNPYSSAANAVFYNDVSGKNNQNVEGTIDN